MIWWHWMLLGGMIVLTPSLIVLALLLGRAMEANPPQEEDRHEW